MRSIRVERLPEKARAAQARSHLLIELAPAAILLPAPIQKYDDPFLPYSRAVIGATSDLVAGYVFDAASYLALGAAGAIALERAVALVNGDALTVLHGPFNHAGWGRFAGDGGLNVDAATIIDEHLADGLELFGVGGLVTGALLGDTLTIAGAGFHLIRQQFLDQFTRDDFANALRDAVGELRV